MTTRWPACLLLLAATAGCGGGSTAAQPATATSTPAPAVSGCPQASAAPLDAWPATVPTSLPRFPGQQVTGSTVDGQRTTVTFTTPTSLRESVLTILSAVPAAGYVLGRGEAERTDAEAPFSDRAVNGAFRVTEVDTCLSKWLLVVEPRDVFQINPQPLVTISAHPSASASAFGG